MKQPVPSIRHVLVGLGTLSALVALCLSALGLAGTQRQASALDQVMMLEQALQNHNDAATFMDDIRADVLRALQASFGANQEGDTVVRADLKHHIEVVRAATRTNYALPLNSDIHDRYRRIVQLVTRFVDAGTFAMELALTDPEKGSRNFEHFRHDFSALESEMDETRDLLRARVIEVRKQSDDTTALVQEVILVAEVVSLLLLAIISALAVRIAQRITADLAHSREQAHHVSLHDTLTGLPNRVLLAERLSQALAHAHRHGTGLAVLYIDLDRFKQVNDTLGHPVGDSLLRAVACRLRDCVRESDTVARIGGDEFAILQAPLAGAEEAGSLSQRLVDLLSDSYEIDGHQVVIGASVGFALTPNDSGEVDELLKMADMALYRAKADGRGTFRSFEPGMDAKLQARRVLELDLRKAVVAGEFKLNYQPLVDLVTGEVTAFEALLRWNHSARGSVPPSDFIPLLEETGLIVALGGWVLRQACADAASWPETVRVAVNLSAVQFKGCGLVPAVVDALEQSGFAAERLELEITESALLQDSEATLAILRELRAIGVRISMDDFGTGYSSLGYLRSFPFDKIKIDRCFVQEIGTNVDCQAIVRAVAGLGLNLGIATTAEGVETREQLEHLRAEGCNEVQGFLFSRPVPIEEASALLARTWNTTRRVGAGLASARDRAELPQPVG